MYLRRHTTRRLIKVSQQADSSRSALIRRNILIMRCLSTVHAKGTALFVFVKKDTRSYAIWFAVVLTELLLLKNAQPLYRWLGLCVFSLLNNARRKDEKPHAKIRQMSREITKRRNNTRRNDEITKFCHSKRRKTSTKDEKTPCEKTQFKCIFCRLFAWRIIVISLGVL